MKLILCVPVFLVFWAIVHGGDCDPDWYDDEYTFENESRQSPGLSGATYKEGCL